MGIGMPLFPSKVTAENDRAYFSWRWLSTCLPVKNDKLIPSFVLVVCMAFVLPLKPSLFQPMDFCAFLILFPFYYGRVRKWLCEGELPEFTSPNCCHPNIKNCEGKQHSSNLFQTSAVLSTINHLWLSPYHIENIG